MTTMTVASGSTIASSRVRTRSTATGTTITLIPQFHHQVLHCFEPSQQILCLHEFPFHYHHEWLSQHPQVCRTLQSQNLEGFEHPNITDLPELSKAVSEILLLETSGIPNIDPKYQQTLLEVTWFHSLPIKYVFERIKSQDSTSRFLESKKTGLLFKHYVNALLLTTCVLEKK